MKWYSHQTYKAHLANIEVYKQIDELKAPFLDWPKSIANIFDRSYPRIGILDLTDLIQEANIAFINAWDKLDWELIDKQKDEGDKTAIITNYLKTFIKTKIQRAIARDRETIRLPENKYNERDPMKQTDIYLTKTFASFFESHLLDVPDEPYGYEQEQVNEILNTEMDRVLTSVEKQVVCMFFGIDQANDVKKPLKEIARWFGKSEIWAKKIKANALTVLKLPENSKVIEKKVLNVYTI
jgi:RNA polymerase sigma factor (sigma-70 family)